MKKSIIISLALMLITSLSSLAVVQEFSPTKVLVDTDNNVVIWQPRQIDYDHEINNKKTGTKDRSVVDRILRKKCGAPRFHI